MARKKMKYENTWYVATVADHKRRMARPWRSSAKPFTHETNEKAEEYARWLAARDGIDLSAAQTANVEYGHCAAGSRPMAVAFMAETPDQARRNRYLTGKPATPVARIGLPNWDFVADEPVETAA